MKATTWNSIAKTLGVSRTTLSRWRRQPGAPASKDAEEWKQYVEQRDLGHADNKPSHSREYYLTQKARYEARRLKRVEDEAAKRIIETAEAVAAIKRIAFAQKSAYWRAIRLIQNRLALNIEDRNMTDEIVRQCERESAQEVESWMK